MPKVSQRGVAHLFLLILILAGIVLGVYLINQKTQLFPYAASNPISGPVSSVGNFVKVTGPNGGETLIKGETRNIIWEGNGANFSLYLVNVDFPQNPGWITTIHDTNQKSFTWQIESLPGKYKIRVTTFPGDGSSVSDDSDGYFTIIDHPIPSPSVVSGPVNPIPSPYKPGDTDGDNDVDIFDYNIVLTDFGKNILPGTPADFDKDGDVDIFDYNTILTYFGT